MIETSEQGQETVFDIFFPKSIQDEIQGIESDDESRQSGSGRILLIDDEPLNIKMTRILLTKLGYEVRAETEWKVALHEFTNDPWAFDVIITDMTMPGMTGDRLAEQFMHIRPDIPVIIFTGYTELLTREQAREKGIADLIMKPLSRAELSKAVRGALDRLKTGGE